MRDRMGVVAEMMPQVVAPQAWPDVVEISHRADGASGYGSLAVQIERALSTWGVSLEQRPMAYSIERWEHRPKEVHLEQTNAGLRWLTDTGETALFGTKTRQWVMDRDIELRARTERVTRPDATRLAIGLPEAPRYGGAGVRAIYTMWESDELPRKFRAWEPHLRRATLAMVPAENSRQVIVDAAPGMPVAVVPLVTEAGKWPLIKRRERDVFTFVTVGDLSIRKGFEMLYQSFWRAFEGRKDVRLVMKTRAGSDLNSLVFWPKKTPDPETLGVYTQDNGGRVELTSQHDDLVFTRDRVRYYVRADPAEPVRVLRGDWRRQALLDLYGMSDCFVWASRGEGWGYPPREAAATGLPVIASAHSGMADAEAWSYCVPFDPHGKTAYYRHWGGACGQLAEPDWDAMVDLMRWVVDNRSEAAAFGQQASAVVTRRTLSDLGRDLLDELAGARND